MPIAVSAHKKSWLLSTVQFYVQKKLKLGDQIMELHELKDHFEVQSKSEAQSKEGATDSWIRLIRHRHFEFKKSECKTAPCTTHIERWDAKKRYQETTDMDVNAWRFVKTDQIELN